MNLTVLDPILYPNLHIAKSVMTDAQWNGLFTNHLSKPAAAKMIIKFTGQKDKSPGAINRLTDDLAQEMRKFRPLTVRKPGAGLIL